MTGLVLIFLFVVLLALPGFYIITRGIFPKGSKKAARRMSLGLTVLLVSILGLVLLTKL